MIRSSRNLAGREIALGEIDSLVRTCRATKGPAGIRDIVIIGLLYIEPAGKSFEGRIIRDLPPWLERMIMHLCRNRSINDALAF